MYENIMEGGVLIWPLMICSVLTVAVVIDRAIAFYNNSRVDSRALRARVLEALRAGKPDEAARLCVATPGPVSAVLLAGLQSYAKHQQIRGRAESITVVVEKAMEDFSQHAISAVEKRFVVLSSIGNAAPLLGMAGTVTGMIVAFKGLASAGSADAPEVGNGIAEALVTTAAGLLIALAAVIPFNYFTSLSDRVALEIEEAASELIDFVATEAGMAPGEQQAKG